MSAIFPKLEGLDSLARRDGVDIRPTLIRVLTDLYVQKSAHSSEEERDYTELVLRLVDSVDLATRITVARKIASYAAAPPAVARRLARDTIEVAALVLRHCAALDSPDLDAIARDMGEAHAAVIAARRASEAPIPPRRIAEPASVKPAQPGQTRFAGQNSEIGIAELFFSADSAARRVLLGTLGTVETETPQSVQPVETIRALEAAALGRDPIGFTRLIEGALGLSQAQAERIVQDHAGEPLLIAAKALAMPSVVLQRVLMFVDPAIGESVQRFFDLAGFYERLSADAAHKIIESMRGREPVRARRPAHRPMYYDDEAARSRRGTATRRLGVSAEPQTPVRTETGKTQRTM